MKYGGTYPSNTLPVLCKFISICFMAKKCKHDKSETRAWTKAKFFFCISSVHCLAICGTIVLHILLFTMDNNPSPAFILSRNINCKNSKSYVKENFIRMWLYEFSFISCADSPVWARARWDAHNLKTSTVSLISVTNNSIALIKISNFAPYSFYFMLTYIRKICIISKFLL